MGTAGNACDAAAIAAASNSMRTEALGPVVESAVDAYDATANADATNSEVAECRGRGSGAASHQGGGSVLHPDVIPFSAALWACVGDPNDALAMGGG